MNTNADITVILKIFFCNFLKRSEPIEYFVICNSVILPDETDPEVNVASYFCSPKNTFEVNTFQQKSTNLNYLCLLNFEISQNTFYIYQLK